MSVPTVGYAGMTHLGVNSAVAMAERGFDVVGFDTDVQLIVELGRGDTRISEPDLTELLAKNKGRLHFTADPKALFRCDVVYLSVDVPTNSEGGSDLAPIHALLSTIGEALSPGASLIILSQVPPGFCRSIPGDASRTFYQVETLIFGRAIERALHPERYMVGCSDPARPLPTAYRRVLEAFECPILTMRYESAELAKIAINMFLVSSVSTTNMLAEVCEKIGADWSEIAPALRLDRRIGQYAYLTPGLGVAGGNLERDLATLRQVGDGHGTDVGLIRAWRANSRYRRDWTLRAIHSAALPKEAAKLTLLGLAYKENTHSTKNSPAMALLAALTPFEVAAYDPVVTPESSWHPRLSRAASALDACSYSDAVVVMTPWPEFKTLDPAAIAGRMRGRLLIDPFCCLDRKACAAAGLRQVVLGATSN
ncbi:MAG TPA: nucleotide sugar dehydrogenase [Pseudolabrys sp.]|nr:nucleotide sugar dehydrogenase [Pseudolabrys sp.]